MVDVIGNVDKTTGIVIDLKVLKDIIKEEIEEVLDHKNLNLDVPYFKKVIPTAENICIFIWDIICILIILTFFPHLGEKVYK